MSDFARSLLHVNSRYQRSNCEKEASIEQKRGSCFCWRSRSMSSGGLSEFLLEVSRSFFWSLPPPKYTLETRSPICFSIDYRKILNECSLCHCQRQDFSRFHLPQDSICPKLCFLSRGPHSLATPVTIMVTALPRLKSASSFIFIITSNSIRISISTSTSIIITISISISISINIAYHSIS